jgi:hypothetical protein
MPSPAPPPEPPAQTGRVREAVEPLRREKPSLPASHRQAFATLVRTCDRGTLADLLAMIAQRLRG